MKNTMEEIFGALPVLTPETAHFWEGTKSNRFVLQRCKACSHVYFPPRPFCEACASRAVETFEASGRGTLYSYSIDLMNGKDGAPVAVAVVELDEGVRLMSNIVETDATPEALVLDMPLEVVFAKVSDDITLTYFRPAAEARS